MSKISNPATEDSHKPDFRIVWINPKSSERGNCKIFTFGQGKELAIASFRVIYPGYYICKIEELNQTG